MTFKKVASSDSVADYLARELKARLGGSATVFWLLSGGSAIAMEVSALKKLGGLAQPERLMVSLVDERYGQPGHADSNRQQFIDAGFESSLLKPVLRGLDLESTVKTWQAELEAGFKKADYVLAVAGIGTDGHTFGIKPDSPALASRGLASGFEWDDYSRITLGPPAVEKIDEIVVYAFGPEKKEQLQRLKQDLSPAEQPAQILKQCSRLTIFNDQIE